MDSSHLDASITRTIREQLDRFVVSLSEGTPALNSFLGSLSTFSNTIRTQRDRLQTETLVAVNNFASIISTVTSDILELEAVTEKFCSDTSEISKILSRKMTKLAITDDQETKLSKVQPAYIKPSYQWLLSNLHNPYPSKETKIDISRRTKCSVKDVDAWFIDIRKRIGWNRLRKTRFSNKQDKIIAAATSIFQPKVSSFTDDLSATLISEMDPNDAYRGEFIAMASHARSLYADRFPELVSSISFDRTTEPATPIRAPTRNTGASNVHLSANSQAFDCNPMAPYPTPEPSPPSYVTEESTPSPVSAFEISQSSSKKRRQPSSDVDESESESLWARPYKRSRFDMNPVANDSVVASLPSPANSIDLSEDSPESNASTLEVNVAESPTLAEMSGLKRKRRLSDGENQRPSKYPHIASTPELVITESFVAAEARLKRKRRLSDGESQCPPKRPHNALSRPRLQTVSDPFPTTKPLPEDLSQPWWQNDTSPEHRSSSIYLPVNLEDPLSVIMPLQVCYDQIGGSDAYLDAYDIQSSLNDLVTGELASFSSESSQPRSGLLDPCYNVILPNSPSNIAVGTANLFDSDGFLLAPDYNVSLNTDLTSFTEDLEQWLTLVQSDDSSNALDSFTPLSVKSHNVNYMAQQVHPIGESVDTKRARLQALREQVSQLEGQLAGQLTA